MNHNRTLTGLLNFYLGAGLATIMLLLSIAGYYLISHILQDALVQKANALAQQVATISLDAVMLQEYGVIERLASDLVKHDPDLLGIRIQNTREQVLTDIQQSYPKHAQTLTVQQPLTFFNKPAGEITLTFSTKSIETPLFQLFALVVFALISLLLGLFWAVKKLLSFHLIHPLQELAQSLNSYQKIFYETLDLKTNLPAELNVLNHAVRELQHALQQHIDSLEQAHQFTTKATQNLCQSQRLATVGQMAAGLAHNLNTPLANIIGYAQMAQMQTEDDKLQKRLVTIERQAKTCAQSVQNLLLAAKPPELNLQPIELVCFISNMLTLINPVAKQKYSASITLNAPNEANSHLDAAALEQILFNLISNSMEAGAKNIVLSISQNDIGQDWHILIADDGQGMTSIIKTKIFEPFFTTKTPDNESNAGTGLGLYLAKTLLEKMASRITLEKSDEQGTTFCIKVPNHA